MTSPNLENLVKVGHLKREPGDRKEFDGLVRSARVRLADARNNTLSLESRFDLAYNAALRWPWRRCAGRATGQTSATRYSSVCRIRSALGLRCGECLRFAMIGATLPNTRGIWKLTNNWSLTCSVRLIVWPVKLKHWGH